MEERTSYVHDAGVARDTSHVERGNRLPGKMKTACYILLASVAVVGASIDAEDGCTRARQLAADRVTLVTSRPGDYRHFVAAVRHKSADDGWESMLPTVVILGGEQDVEIAQEVASNLALWGGYALVVNGSQVELELGLTVGERLSAHLDYLKAPVVRAIRKDKIRSLPGPALFANIANNGVNKVAFVATPDPFPSAKNYVVLGIGSSSHMAMALAQQGWPASVAMDPSSTVIVPSELGNGTVMVLTGQVTRGDRIGQETREVVEAGHVLRAIPFSPDDIRYVVPT